MTNSLTPDSLRERLVAELGADCVLTDSAEFAAWTTDWRGIYHGQAAAVVRPRSTEEVAACLRLCSSLGVPVVPRGGNTGLCGGATPDDNPLNVVLSLARMNRIRSIDPLANVMIAEAGCILETLQLEAAAHSRLFPLSLAAEGSCQLGGNLATNAGGINVLRYGMTRELVLGLEVVLPSGEIWNGLRTLRKDNTGYDLKQLFIGSEGTLGIITAASLRLFPATPARAIALAAVESPRQALELFSLLSERCGQRIQAFEYFSGKCLDLVLSQQPDQRAPFAEPHEAYVLIELGDSGDEAALSALLESALGEAIEAERCIDVVVAASLAQGESLWQLREDISEAQRLDGPHVKHDVSLPIEHIPRFLNSASQRLNEAYPGLRLFIFGHFGDGNLHYNVSRPAGAPTDFAKHHGDGITAIVLEEVYRLDGSFSAEHGVGQLKREYLHKYKSPLEQRLMKEIKKIFDPTNIMNPGKML